MAGCLAAGRGIGFATMAALALLLPAPCFGQEAGAASDADANPKPATLAQAIGLPGVAPRLDLTGYAQGLVEGDDDKDVKFTGRFDLFTDFSSDGMGLWKGTVLRTHLEWRANDAGAGQFGGSLFPANSGALLPITGQKLELTSLFIAQRIDPSTNLLLGKINALDLLASDPFFGGLGTKRFQNIAFVAPPSGVMPPIFMGGVLTHQAGDVGLTAMVFDPDDHTGDYWVDGLFSSGVNFSLGGTWQGTVNDSPTSIGLTAAFSTKRGTDFKEILLPPDLQTSTKKGSYNISLQLGHLLVESQSQPGKGLGLYVKGAIADGNPNFVQSSIVGGLAGHGLIGGRERDSFGLGGFYYNFSNVLQDTVAPIVTFEDEYGLEAWYQLSLTPRTALTFDTQVVSPADGSRETAFIAGLRLGVSY